MQTIESTQRLPIADVERLADEIAELSANIDAASHRLLTLIHRFDAGAGWFAHGALTCAHWLAWRIGLDLGAAREQVRVARALAGLPVIDDALRRGQVSYSKVRALTRVADAENETSLLEMARSSTASQLERICRGYRRALRGLEGERPEDEVERRWVRERGTESGMVRIEAQLSPEEAAVVRSALELAMSRAWKGGDVSAETFRGRKAGDVSAETLCERIIGDVSVETPVAASGVRSPSRPFEIPPSLRRADALVAMAESYLAADAGAEAGPPIEVVVHVEADAIADRDSDEGGTLDDGTSLPRATVERLACDSAVVKVVGDGRGGVLDIGRRRRTIPSTLRRALRLRDRGCRFPGCTNRRVDGHHVVPWSRGGETKLSNLLSACRRHHRFVHELGFRIDSDGRGGFAFFAPNGREVKASCQAPTLGEGPVESLRDQNRAAGIAIDAQTGFPRWDGTPADYDHIVLCLMARHHSSVNGACSPASEETPGCSRR